MAPNMNVLVVCNIYVTSYHIILKYNKLGINNVKLDKIIYEYAIFLDFGVRFDILGFLVIYLLAFM